MTKLDAHKTPSSCPLLRLRARPVPEAEVHKRSAIVFKMAALNVLVSGCGRFLRGLLTGPIVTSWARPPARGFREGECWVLVTSKG